MDGMILIDKPQSFTSFDVVAVMRGLFHQKKVGHTGTLDPMATGVLPILLGKATRCAPFLEDTNKEYQAQFQLGTATDTQDSKGNVVAVSEHKVTRQELEQVLPQFRGEILQLPPMYSAVQKDGQRLYVLARQGIEVEREKRPVTIFKCELVSFDENTQTGTLCVACSKGTYIRTLCHDIGEKLGCGGCMEALIRTRVGRFELKDSISLKELEKIRDEERLGEYLVSVEEMFLDQPKASALPEADSLVHNGNPVKPELVKVERDQTYTDQQLFRMYDSDQQFLGVYRYEEDRKWLKPWKMFLGGN